MTAYSVYDISSGEITKHLACTEEILILNLSDGESYIEGEFSSREFKVVGGIAVSKTPEEMQPTIQELTLDAREHRDMLLAATDWRFRSDMNPSQAWIDYCQALRDVPQQAGFPTDIIWPEKPQ